MARMTRPIVSIKDITDEKELWKIAVRIVDMWTVVNKANEEHLEMVFMDAKGDKIHAIVPKEETQTWKAKLKEHNTYVFENFVVFKNDFLFKVCDHHYKMIFSDGTIFKENELLDIPPFQYHFKDFAEILSGNFRPDFLVDLIGAFHKLLSSHPEADPKRVVFIMKDISGNLVQCTLWQETAMKFLNYYNERRHVRPIVMILTHARIKPAEGKYPASISNSFHGSKLLFDEEILEIQQFKKSLPADEANETSTQIVSQFTGGSQFSDHDRFMYNAQVKSIQEINNLKQETTCVTIGTTGKFIVSKNGWSYPGCSTCTKRATAVDGPFTCEKGHYNEGSVPRYKLEIRVFHKKHSAKFLFWDHDSETMIGKSALELMNKMIEEGECNPKAYPVVLDDMLARTLAFRVRVQPGYNQCSVIKVWDDAQMIQTIMDQIETEETSKLNEKGKSIVNEDLQLDTTAKFDDKPKPDHNDYVQFDTQSLSGTAEHDPDMLATITPAKRVSSEIQFDEKPSQELATAQLSSTKVTKQIKTE